MSRSYGLWRSMRFSLIALITLGTALILTPCAEAQNLRSLFERMDANLNNGQGYSSSLNTKGTLAWGEGYLLMAYVDMYRSTGDRSWLDKLVDQFDTVLSNRDDVLHIKDYYRNKPIAGWGSDEYSSGKWHVWAVHTAMICEGPMEFVELVKAEQRLKKPYSKIAARYLIKIKECVAAQDPYWHDGPGPMEGYYSDPAIGPLPLNQQNALGMLNLGLYLVTRDHLYRNRVERLAMFFKKRIRIRPDGSYDWSYWPKPDGSGTDSEDISHAAINVAFACKCAKAHIVFNKADMMAFVKTWMLHVHRADGVWADDINGDGGENTYMPAAVWGWSYLCPYDHKILSDMTLSCSSITEDQTNGANLLALASVLRWEHALTKKHRWLWW